jgi:hypothetical protein
MKRISLTVEGCADCPFARFDHGSLSRDSGWDCAKTNQRIVDQGDRWDFYDAEPGEEGEELPMTLEGVMAASNIYLYPDWCPLPEAE